MALEVDCVFSTFESFETARLNYQKENHVLYVKNGSKKLPPFHPAAEELVYHSVKFACKQGKKGRPSASKGLRPNQKSLKIGCPAQFRLAILAVEGQWFLRITNANHRHENHSVDPTTAALYPENRRVNVDDTIKVMVYSKVPKRELKDFIQTTQKKVVLRRDLNNLTKRLLSASDKSELESANRNEDHDEAEHMYAANNIPMADEEEVVSYESEVSLPGPAPKKLSSIRKNKQPTPQSKREEPMACCTHSVVEQDEPLVLWFKSLLPQIKSLPSDQRFAFQIRTMQDLQGMVQSSTSVPVIVESKTPATAMDLTIE